MKRKTTRIRRADLYNNYVPLFVDLYQHEGVVNLRMALGAEGYGIYCLLLQLLRSQKTGKLQRNYEVLAFALQLDVQHLKAVVENFDLFVLEPEHGTFFSPWLSETMRVVQGESQPAAAAPSDEDFSQSDDAQLVAPDLAIDAPEGNLDFQHSVDFQDNAGEALTRVRVKKEKKKERTEDLPTLFSDENSVGEAAPTAPIEQKEEGKSFRRGVTRVKAVRLNPPTVEEVAAYAESKGYEAFDAEHFVDYHTEKGWQTVHGDMVSWQSAVRTWHRNDVRYAAQQAELRAERQQRQERIDAERRAREEARDAEFRRQSEEKHRAWMMKNADANEKSRLFHEQRDREIAAFVQEAIYAPPTNYDDLPF